ncbi:unnamed protein product [Gongylonema pulchrum]|uniref:C-type lectin domain-containing protein n=1 Tax=Gongylonema pulchrum TaxID=637853 RepID=A0A183E7M8_9BILA|nr:unnamed protein product [Gongylonema pulchrum]
MRAYQKCVAWNATIAAPEDALQDAFIRRVYGNDNPYWIGVRKIVDRWMKPVQSKQFGYTLVNYTNWGSSQPDGCCWYDVTCVVVNYGNTLGKWDDQDCYSYVRSAGAVCQKQSL